MGGLNAVQAYIPWNFHNTEIGTYNLTLIELFLNTAKEAGLLVVLRAGPYACGEWEFGGFPYWILQQFPDIFIRSSDPNYLKLVAEWWGVLLPVLKPHLYSNGGNVILMQIENEYGSYGDDKIYLTFLKDLLVQYLGEGSVIIHSTDGNADAYLLRTYIPGVFQTVDFGPGQDIAAAFAMQHDYSKVGPYMNSEYYTGWLTHWGDANFANVSADFVVKWLGAILAYENASVNMYMYHGGTNFGFWNGANSDGSAYQPVVTSYDYDAPLDEAGDPTDKYVMIRDTIANFTSVPSGPLPTPSKRAEYGVLTMNQQVSLFAPGVLTALVAQPVPCASPYSFETLGNPYGFVLYRTNLTRSINAANTLNLTPRDRAWVFLDGSYLGIVMRGDNTSITLPASSNATSQLDILVENMGRINYGSAMTDPKGLGQGVIVDYSYHFNWIAYPLPLTDLSMLSFQDRTSGSGPSFFRGTFKIEGEPLDTFLNTQGWQKGLVFVNGFNLGRYWWVGPQLSLYVPAPVLLTGENEIIVFELEGTDMDGMTSQAAPIFTSEK